MLSPSESGGFPTTSEPSALATCRLTMPLNAELSGRRRQIFRDGDFAPGPCGATEFPFEVCCADRTPECRKNDRMSSKRKKRRTFWATASGQPLPRMKVKEQAATAPQPEQRKIVG